MKPRAKVIDRTEAQPEWEIVADIPGFPFETFDQMQAAAAIKSFNVGVDPLAAANWSSRFCGSIEGSTGSVAVESESPLGSDMNTSTAIEGSV